MPKKLTRKDYETILAYYKVPFEHKEPLSSIRGQAEKVLSSKLCRCIKSVSTKSDDSGEKRAIAICKSSILHRKKLSESGFKCRKHQSIKLKRIGGSRNKTRRLVK